MDGDVRIGTSSEAIASADIIVLALPGAAVAQVVADNVSVLEGKTIIDASNNMRGEARHALDYLREAVPSACLYRAFNTLGWENFENPDFDGVAADLYYCGDEREQPVVEQLISDVGLTPVYLGGVENVGLVEGMTNMWFHLALRQKMGRRIAFKLLS